MSGKLQRGAQPQNQSAFRHGLRGAMLPPGCSYITGAVNTFRKAMEAAVVEKYGEISLIDAATIQTAYRFERHAQLAQRWLRKEGAAMNVTERLAYSAAIAKASAERDKCLKALGLDGAAAKDPWDVVHGSVVNGAHPPVDATPTTETTTETPPTEVTLDATTEPQEGTTL